MHTMLLFGASEASGLVGLQVRLAIVPAVAPVPAPAVVLGAHVVFTAAFVVPVFVQVRVTPVTFWPGLNTAGTLLSVALKVVVVSLTVMVAVAVSHDAGFVAGFAQIW